MQTFSAHSLPLSTTPGSVGLLDRFLAESGMYSKSLTPSDENAAARQKGVRFGRPPKLSAEQIALGQHLLAEGTSVRAAARILNCHHATLYRALATTGTDAGEANGSR